MAKDYEQSYVQPAGMLMITSTAFMVAVAFVDGKAVCGPVLKWARGKSREEVIEQCGKLKWKVEEL